MYWYPTKTIEETKTRIEKWSKSYENNFLYFIVERHLDEPIGFICAVKLDEFSYGDIGLCIGERFVHKNIGTKILKWFISYLENKGIGKIYYTCNKENIASSKLAEKCGFEFFKEEVNINRKTNDSYVKVTYLYNTN